MLPISNLAPINPLPESFANPGTLADAFAEFSLTAGRLERSYQELQREVTQLRAILAERNQALRSSRAENAEMKLALRRIVDALPCGVLVLNSEQRVTLINPEARRLLGMGEEKVESLANTPLSGHAALQAAIDSGPGDEVEDQICITTSLNPRWLAVRSRKLTPADADRGKQHESAVATRPRTILILRDTTSQRRLESDREKARNVVALAEMAAVLGHEIRNPLASLELFASLLDDGTTDTSEYVTQLRAGIRSLSATVDNVLRLYGGGALQLVPLVLGEALGRIVEFVRPLAEQKQIALSFTDTTESLTIAGDQNAIQQLIMNLSINAFRHTASGGSLKITASSSQSRSGRRARIDFCDSGCGIPAEHLSRLFEAGFSVSGQTPGLGLAVCRQIVEQHGGSIRVSSQPGVGSTFTVELPRP